jgi:hypothetical protein
LSRSSRINKSTAVGALAACAVIGATSPVWADSGSNASPDAPAVSPQDSAVLSALQNQIAKLETQVQSEQSALSAATHAVAKESKALAVAQADAAHWKAVAKAAAANVTTVPVTPATAHAAADPADNGARVGRHCHHGDGEDGDSQNERGDFNGNDNSRGSDHTFGADWNHGPGR